ncbi:uncharacterized protein SPAPADRAFT_145671 [Spathaspora passalidarum NRRL Y-27907]|uniref:PH domain-containing protein n=1 Tax=Spathaspora passalidarum (strain NRRL Y-27907 / 11-Y1) TaxID=619300 RepID=G3AFH5_SPAPN|nr:uncharacterized protein SPAPADRAFT_145671 [Spathaspora passalidarum NRRL Y-27907]EGW34964.1 hypothetical protein SPAPADRAFT_145671 [Spathaspora passalidarum NRRL Y-27907]
MSQLLYKYFLKKTNLDHIVQMGDDAEDPYFETIPDNELHFYQRKGAKRKRRMPNFIPKNDLKVLNKVKSRAYHLDLQLSLCGLRLGWAGIIGLIPWIGDVISLLFALQLVKKAGEIEGGLPKILQAEMMANVMMDFGIGLIPFVGDFINILYKCNSRNFILLEKHLVKKYSHGQTVHVTSQPATTSNEKSKKPKEPEPNTKTAAAATATATADAHQETGTYDPHHGPTLPSRAHTAEHNVHHAVPPINDPVPPHTIDADKAAYVAEKV